MKNMSHVDVNIKNIKCRYFHAQITFTSHIAHLYNMG